MGWSDYRKQSAEAGRFAVVVNSLAAAVGIEIGPVLSAGVEGQLGTQSAGFENQ